MQAICQADGCGKRLRPDNAIGFCRSHRAIKTRSEPRSCAIADCGRLLHARSTSGFCPAHAAQRSPSAVKRDAARLAKAEERIQWRECAADGCTKKLRPDNKSGRCYDHKHVPVDLTGRSQCPIEGCGRRLSPKNTVGRCEKHTLPRRVAAECAAEGCTRKLNVNNLAGLCLQHTDNNGRGKRLQRIYGISEGQYDAMLAEQGGVCAVCGQPPKPGGVKSASNLHVDHDHACCPGRRSCGKCVRALLCLNCNPGLGHFLHDPALLRRAADYLERRPALTLT